MKWKSMESTRCVWKWVEDFLTVHFTVNYIFGLNLCSRCDSSPHIQVGPHHWEDHGNHLHYMPWASEGQQLVRFTLGPCGLYPVPRHKFVSYFPKVIPSLYLRETASCHSAPQPPFKLLSHNFLEATSTEAILSTICLLFVGKCVTVQLWGNKAAMCSSGHHKQQELLQDILLPPPPHGLLRYLTGPLPQFSILRATIHRSIPCMTWSWDLLLESSTHV